MRPTIILLMLLATKFAVAQRFAIAADRMNIAYIAIDNPLSSASFSCADKNLVLHTDNGAIIRTSDGYVFRPEHPGVAEVAAYCVKGRDSVLLGKVPFRIKDLPSPRLYVGGKPGGPIKKGALLVQQGIIANLDGFDFDARFSVTSYECSVWHGGVVGTSIRVSGPYFTLEIKASFQMLVSGDRVFFDNVKYLSPDGRIRDAGTLTLMIE